MADVNCLLLILQGSVFTGITCTWTNLIGLWFYAIMIFIVEIALFLKTDNLSAPSVLGIFLGILMLPFLPPSAWVIPIGILAVNIAAILYNAFVRET